MDNEDPNLLLLELDVRVPVTFPVPLKLCPQIVRDVANLVAELAFPDKLPEKVGAVTVPEPLIVT